MDKNIDITELLSYAYIHLKFAFIRLCIILFGVIGLSIIIASQNHTGAYFVLAVLLVFTTMSVVDLWQQWKAEEKLHDKIFNTFMDLKDGRKN